jgi:hypothetical protein
MLARPRRLKPADEFRQSHVERTRQAPEHVEPGIADASFNPGDEGPVALGTLGHVLLCQPESLPKRSHTPPERRAQIVHGAESCPVAVSISIDDELY